MSLPEERRKAIFKTLVETQDAGLSSLRSRTAVARQFEVSESQVRRVEQEGLEKEWPPL
jgi:hypothetical protein